MRKVWQVIVLGIVLSFTSAPELQALTEVSGSPFAVGASAPIALATSTGTSNPFLFTANLGSSSVTRLTITTSDGKLSNATQNTGAGYTSGGPIDLAVAPGPILLLLNQASNAVSAFTIGGDGTLTHKDISCTGPSKTTCAANTGDGQDPDPAGIAVRPSGSAFYVTNQASNTISAFTLSGGGTIGTPVVTSTVTNAKPAGIAATDSFVFVANNGLNNTGTTVSVFQIGSTPFTTLTEVTGQGSPFSLGTGASGPIGVAVDTTNSRLFVSNNGSSNVSAFTFDSNGKLTAVSGSPFSLGTGASSPKGLTLISTSSLIVANQGGTGTISIFSVGSGGALSAISGSPFKVGSAPSDVGVPSSVNFFYVVNAGDGTISAFSTSDLPGATGGIPTLSEWGMIILVLLLLTLAAWKLSRGPAPVGMPVRR